MKMFWFCNDIQNFGDIVPAYVMEKLTGIKPEYFDKQDKPHLLYGGSVLPYANSNSIIYGCGFADKTQRLNQKPLKIISVRGKLSRQMLIEQGHDCPECYGDMCNFLPSIFNPVVEKEFDEGYFPHHSDYEYVKNLVGADLSINICGGIENIIRKIKKFEKIYCSSLHAIVVCQVYGIKWEWVKWGDNIPGDGMKFLDYFSTLNLYNYKNLKPIQL